MNDIPIRHEALLFSSSKFKKEQGGCTLARGKKKEEKNFKYVLESETYMNVKMYIHSKKNTTLACPC